jgi:hypothetical protein
MTPRFSAKFRHQSSIDQCRNALAALLSRWLVAEGTTDPFSATAREDRGDRRPDAFRKGHGEQSRPIVGRLHSRGKTNEVHSKGLREPEDENAELALTH